MAGAACLSIATRNPDSEALAGRTNEPARVPRGGYITEDCEDRHAAYEGTHAVLHEQACSEIKAECLERNGYAIRGLQVNVREFGKALMVDLELEASTPDLTVVASTRRHSVPAITVSYCRRMPPPPSSASDTANTC